ncbi:unnamed protein product [Sphenostylis stenocarpa]|uniref:Amino acid transporter transmembrane domain-containing protein n=1 Tax=Sphenostylis stenocarpa TaxID=92480 RepID=A0AA86VP30_9FABA|nr:unnamed protein product [Sphenostylis stenocarpa]
MNEVEDVAGAIKGGVDSLLDDDRKPRRHSDKFKLGREISRDSMDRKCTYNNSSDWCWSVVYSLGHGTIGMDNWHILNLAPCKWKGKSTSLMWGSKIQSPSHFWNILIALGNIALASSYSQIGVDIQDSLKSSPPENKVMKTANKIGVGTMTTFFLLCGCSGYATFGSDTPGNILLSSGLGYIAFHLVIQSKHFVHKVHRVAIQPIFSLVETWARQRWASSGFVHGEHPMSMGKMKIKLNFFRLVWRSIFVVILTVLAMAMPFFNEMIALLGRRVPVEMYITRKKIKKGMRWFGLKTLSLLFMLLAVASACAAIRGIYQSLHKYKPFKYKE